jgi:hypothetical protein
VEVVVAVAIAPHGNATDQAMTTLITTIQMARTVPLLIAMEGTSNARTATTHIRDVRKNENMPYPQMSAPWI